MIQGMAYRIYAKIKDSDGTFSAVVSTAKDALAKLAELAELDQVEVAAMDLSGTIVELASLQAEANQAPSFRKERQRAPSAERAVGRI